MNEKEKIFDKDFWNMMEYFGILIFIILLLPLFFTLKIEWLNFTETGQIGDTIGGTMTPFVAIAAALLTFLAFWVQYKANLTQTLQFKKQAENVTIERFENKFYEAIRLHKENVNEIEISKPSSSNFIKGRKSFISMFFEFRFCYVQVKKFIEDSNKKEIGFDFENEKIIIDIAYHIFFMGIGDNSDALVIKSLSGVCEQQFIIDLIGYLNTIKKKRKDAEKPIEYKVKLNDNPNPLVYKANYIPFGGHISRLGHYFRHLYQTVKIISQQDEEIINTEMKQAYAKILRAQLSDFEQLLLFYNINSTLGNAWIKGNNNFIKEYRMIKNMPVPLADFGIKPNEIFSTEIKYWESKNKSFFEWDERKQNI